MDVKTASLNLRTIHESRPINLEEYLSIQRVTVGLHVSSKKRLLEEIAILLLKNNPQINHDTVFQMLIERERLGSTGIGHGMALPHGRVSDLEKAIIAVARLKQPLEFKSIDKQPITTVIGLLVPADANEEHLQLLAYLANMASDSKLRDQLSEVTQTQDLYDILINWRPTHSD